MKKNREIYLILNDIRSASNVGSIFRTADAAGANKIFLCGYTPAPLDRFGRPVKQLIKTSLGAEKNISWEKGRAFEVVNSLKEKGFFIVAIEQSDKSVDYKTVRPSLKTAFVFGNEVDGLPRSLLSLADIVAEIPMKGRKESLNVSVAAGISIFRILSI
ncbi:MAG: hypothetical protein A2653_01950 [Candidatus Zambryskibacteria bacterium RIFCSPHIGHO2_01_FULL_43_25]|uniref:tRNA/rRNA methyltransferase SpoU type domain-containing protein n=1 Tax=Candidatus Zambryskibacteria bacterium RIFCSPLOWO2_01_FULL_45_21 TaxID=1802761 RepID=A0A1G2U498_9BACT|nr:MAG: hypothetical protein A2653_01950 [Candidatus Zambryskibacteria bacterium RIFCSPHIGHO2_01_FULL_43_25]OHB00737.1 MAG: hypothetical protein A3E94_02835 [Candidatus Zambryskibacteria bacterium RIFCSPHIGHO2_12_FULL_44_12b]OHB04333.1 MAG: hypothetical protein A3B14_02590 [Candidatus Zambryskibacteria bacterium RIFCSPLOWO2_01_FULL_45_21]